MNYPDDYINKIIQGDCLEVMKGIPDKSVDLVVTDPPYGIKRDKGFRGFRGFGKKIASKKIARKKYDGDWDKSRPNKIYFDEILRISKNSLMFGGNFFADMLPLGKHWIVWDKLNTMPTFGDCELVWTNINRNSVKKITYEYNGLIGKEKTRHHATQKPVKLLKILINNYSKPGEIICDPFLGSGTTAVACAELDRRFIGIELDAKYCDIAQKRVNKVLNQVKLFPVENLENTKAFEEQATLFESEGKTNE